MKFLAVTFWHRRAMQLYPISNIIHGAMCVLVIECADKLCYLIVEVAHATASGIDRDYCKSPLGDWTQDQLVVKAEAHRGCASAEHLVLLLSCGRAKSCHPASHRPSVLSISTAIMFSIMQQKLPSCEVINTYRFRMQSYLVYHEIFCKNAIFTCLPNN